MIREAMGVLMLAVGADSRGDFVFLFIVRTALEDRALLEALDGYREYAQRFAFIALHGWGAEIGWPIRERLRELDLEDLYEPMIDGR